MMIKSIQSDISEVRQKRGSVGLKNKHAILQKHIKDIMIFWGRVIVHCRKSSVVTLS